MTDTHLLLEGVAPEAISADFLVGVMDVADECGLDVSGVSVIRR